MLNYPHLLKFTNLQFYMYKLLKNIGIADFCSERFGLGFTLIHSGFSQKHKMDKIIANFVFPILAVSIIIFFM